MVATTISIKLPTVYPNQLNPFYNTVSRQNYDPLLNKGVTKA